MAWRTQKFSLRNKRFNGPQLAVFIIGLAAIGSYVMFHSFAASLPLPTGPSDLVLGFDSTGQEVVTATPTSTPVNIRVYGSGLTICGNASASSSGKNAPYYQKQLSTAELHDLVQKVADTGFLDFKQDTSGVKLALSENTMSLNLKSGLYQIPYSVGPKPAAYAATESIIKQFCDGLSEPYVPSQVTVYAKQVTDPTQTGPITDKPAEISVNTTSDQLNTQTVSGQAATNVVLKVGRTQRHTYTYQGKLYETSTYIHLPSAQAPDHPRNVSTAKKENSSIVEAATAPKAPLVQYALFCATDSCTAAPRSLTNYSGITQSFYKTQTKKVYNLTTSATITGSHPMSWYLACHSTSCPLATNPACFSAAPPTGCTDGTNTIPDTFLNAVINISNEKGYYTASIAGGNLTFKPLHPPVNNTQFILGFSTKLRNECGVTTISTPSTITAATYGIVDFSDPGAGGHCNNQGNNEDEVISAHELGHSFGFQHTTGSVDANGQPNGGIMAYDDMRRHLFPSASYLTPAEISSLQNSSVYFHTNSGNDTIANLLPMTSIFAKNVSGNVATKWFSTNMGASSWGTVPAAAAVQSAVAPASSGRGDLDLFAKNSSGALIHSWFSNFGWSNWENLGGGMQDYPAAVSWGPNRYDVFVRGTNNALYQKFWNGSTWSNWISLGGTVTSAPAASSWGTRRLDVFMRNQNNNLQIKSFNGTSWSGFTALSGVITTAPTAVSWGPNHIDVFALNSSNALEQRTYDNGAWSGWKNLGVIPNGISGSAPTVTSSDVGKLQLFTRSITNTVLTATMTNGVLSAWQDTGGSIQSSPSAISWR